MQLFNCAILFVIILSGLQNIIADSLQGNTFAANFILHPGTSLYGYTLSSYIETDSPPGYHHQESARCGAAGSNAHANGEQGLYCMELLYQYGFLRQELREQGQTPDALQRQVPDDEKIKTGRKERCRHAGTEICAE
jgi:hypothetical protein